MKNTNDNKGFITKPLGIGMLACLCCLLWGSATPAIKIGYEWFGIGAGDVASRILFAGVRFILAGVLTVIFGSIIAGKTLIPPEKLLGYDLQVGHGTNRVSVHLLLYGSGLYNRREVCYYQWFPDLYCDFDGLSDFPL